MPLKKGDKEVKVEMEFVKNRLIGLHIRMANRKTKKLTPAEREKIRKFVWTYQGEIKQKWEDFRAGKAIKMEKISREIK
ncbi:hypothetical protein GWC95_16680 [Sediminibacterium roseum]|uniref:Uncharacterized protein n=1 Tax=Sediminibacterium roseum TaxID=1978412 RepID=A0ABX0A0U4_9BACT|nr:hypothetical protein [Sediminibacterium roseum]NCI51567.1 hypothetical protein [Sediminibacterium roseum]